MTFSGGPFRFSSRFRLSYFVQLTLIPTSWYLEAPTAVLYSSLSSTLHCLHCSVSWDHTPLLLLRVPVMGLGARATLVLCLADHATHPPVWSQHSPPVQLPCTVCTLQRNTLQQIEMSCVFPHITLLMHYCIIIVDLRVLERGQRFCWCQGKTQSGTLIPRPFLPVMSFALALIKHIWLFFNNQQGQKDPLICSYSFLQFRVLLTLGLG